MAEQSQEPIIEEYEQLNEEYEPVTEEPQHGLLIEEFDRAAASVVDASSEIFSRFAKKTGTVVTIAIVGVFVTRLFPKRVHYHHYLHATKA